MSGEGASSPSHSVQKTPITIPYTNSQPKFRSLIFAFAGCEKAHTHMPYASSFNYVIPRYYKCQFTLLDFFSKNYKSVASLELISHFLFFNNFSPLLYHYFFNWPIKLHINIFIFGNCCYFNNSSCTHIAKKNYKYQLKFTNKTYKCHYITIYSSQFNMKSPKSDIKTYI